MYMCKYVFFTDTPEYVQTHKSDYLDKGGVWTVEYGTIHPEHFFHSFLARCCIMCMYVIN